MGAGGFDGQSLRALVDAQDRICRAGPTVADVAAALAAQAHRFVGQGVLVAVREGRFFQVVTGPGRGPPSGAGCASMPRVRSVPGACTTCSRS